MMADSEGKLTRRRGGGSPLRELRHEAPDRRTAFQRYTEHAEESFRSDLYESEKPRSILFLTLAVAIVIYVAFTRDTKAGEDGYDLRSNAQAAFMAGTAFFCVYGAVQFRDSLMVRPHPMIWRVIHALGVIYVIILCVLLVQTLDSARSIVRLLSPQEIETFKPADPFVQASTVNHCELSWPSLHRQLTSPWMVSHFLGWMGKMCLFRDVKFVMVASGLFELAELTLQFIIPEFKECWWDSLFLDFLGANLLGIIIGNFLIKFLNSRNYDWLDEYVEPESPSTAATRKSVPKIERYIDMLMPFSWSEYRWQFFSTPARFMGALMMMVGQLAIDLNSFFLLHMLQIPVSNRLNHMRLILIALLSFPALSEWYAYTTGVMHRLGPNIWLSLCLIIVECLIVLKFSLSIEQFQRLPPLNIVLPWLLCILFASLFVVFYYQSRLRAWLSVPLNITLFGRTLMVITRARVLAILHACALLPLIALTWHWKY
eukprot:m.225813 g.225813  ORF g.225813 m.225813 type:complete len:486 (-) comp11323_c0_seq1:1764-3221(-)